MGEPLTGRPVAQLLLPEISGVGLGHRPGLDRGERGPRLLDLLDTTSTRSSSDRLVHHVASRSRIIATTSRQSRRRAGLRVELRDRHTNIEAVATDNPGDIRRLYLDMRDNPQKNDFAFLFRWSRTLWRRSTTPRWTAYHCVTTRRRPSCSTAATATVKGPDAGFWLARDDDRLVGYAALTLNLFENLDGAKILGAVHPDHRRRGIGRHVAGRPPRQRPTAATSGRPPGTEPPASMPCRTSATSVGARTRYDGSRLPRSAARPTSSPAAEASRDYDLERFRRPARTSCRRADLAARGDQRLARRPVSSRRTRPSGSAPTRRVSRGAGGRRRTRSWRGTAPVRRTGRDHRCSASTSSVRRSPRRRTLGPRSAIVATGWACG